MRSALITGVRSGATTMEVVVAPGEPREVGQKFHALVGDPGDLTEIYLWDSNAGVTRRKKFAVTQNSPVTENQPETVPSVPASEEAQAPVVVSGGDDDDGPTLATAGDPKPRKSK